MAPYGARAIEKLVRNLNCVGGVANKDIGQAKHERKKRKSPQVKCSLNKHQLHDTEGKEKAS